MSDSASTHIPNPGHHMAGHQYIHSTFPSMGSAQRAHEGSQSSTPSDADTSGAMERIGLGTI